jgi:hypothetical protein
MYTGGSLLFTPFHSNRLRFIHSDSDCIDLLTLPDPRTSRHAHIGARGVAASLSSCRSMKQAQSRAQPFVLVRYTSPCERKRLDVLEITNSRMSGCSRVIDRRRRRRHHPSKVRERERERERARAALFSHTNFRSSWCGSKVVHRRRRQHFSIHLPCTFVSTTIEFAGPQIARNP